MNPANQSVAGPPMFGANLLDEWVAMSHVNAQHLQSHEFVTVFC
jgi:hypothetical protein